MVNVETYFPQKVGATMDIKDRIIGYDKLGTGTFSTINSTEADFSGSVKILGKTTKITLSGTVSSDTKASLNVNGDTVNCTYVVSDGAWNLTAESPWTGTVDITVDGQSTYIDLDVADGSTKYKYKLEIEPES